MIIAERLPKTYGPKTAVDGISFTVQPGKVTGFLGPNGAGKSTTMRMIVGLDRPTDGTVTVNGRPQRPAPVTADRGRRPARGPTTTSRGPCWTGSSTACWWRCLSLAFLAPGQGSALMPRTAVTSQSGPKASPGTWHRAGNYVPLAGIAGAGWTATWPLAKCRKRRSDLDFPR